MNDRILFLATKQNNKSTPLMQPIFRLFQPSVNGRTLETSHPDKDPVNSLRLVGEWAGRSAWVSGGTLTEKKMPKEVHFRSLSDCVKAPKGVFMAGDEPGNSNPNPHGTSTLSSDPPQVASSCLI